MKKKYDSLMELASRKSIFYPAAEIYANSPAGFWDFGPIGQSIRRKIIEFWRHELVQKENMLEMHGAQILPQPVFEGSGHLKSFTDPIVQCIKCRKYERADVLVTEVLGKNISEATSLERLDNFIAKYKIKCPKCKGEIGKVTKFNMMVESLVGKQGGIKTFLRPESCQSIFLNFPRMVKTMRITLPQGIAQVGGVFRNEISPRQSINRSIEFSQMEAEIFFDPNQKDIVDNFEAIANYKLRILRLGKKEIEEITAKDLVTKKIVSGKLIAYFLARTQQTWTSMGIPLTSVRFREVDKEERAFYSQVTFDFEVETSLGWIELIANNYRTDYDLKSHSEHSKTNMEYLDPVTNKKFIPHIWEISAGVDRTMYAILEHALKEGKEGLYLSLNPKLAPYICAVFPLVKKEKLPELAKKVETLLKEAWLDVFYDESGSIGRRYARADEIGIPYCLTIDGESLRKNDLTIRERDTGKQIRIPIKKIKQVLLLLQEQQIPLEKVVFFLDKN